MTTTSSGRPEIAKSSMRRVIPAALIGSALEWYDFYLYAVASALVFNHIIFPGGNDFVRTLAAFSTLAIGYFIRPLGGAILAQRMDDILDEHHSAVDQDAEIDGTHRDQVGREAQRVKAEKSHEQGERYYHGDRHRAHGTAQEQPHQRHHGATAQRGR